MYTINYWGDSGRYYAMMSNRWTRMDGRPTFNTLAEAEAEAARRNTEGR
jgi:hypothetical protein